jgi:hypothetical protein
VPHRGAGKQVYNSLLNMCVWVKDTGGMGSLYQIQNRFLVPSILGMPCGQVSR